MGELNKGWGGDFMRGYGTKILKTRTMANATCRDKKERQQEEGEEK